jgi:hypothetical protein
LIVPAGIHKQYPGNSNMDLLQVDEFVELVRRKLA